MSAPVTKDLMFEEGEVVWAKVRGYPPWPALVINFVN